MNKGTKQLIVLLSILSVALPAVAAAQGNPFAPYWGPFVSCVGASADPGATICTSFCDLLVTGQNLIKFGMTLVIYILAPLFILWGGILILISGSSPSLLSRGKSIIFGAAIGVALTLVGYVIVATFLFLIGNGTNPGNTAAKIAWPNISCTVLPGIPVCGNNSCETGENQQNCSLDCGGAPPGGGGGNCPGGAGCACQTDNQCNGMMTCLPLGNGVCTVPGGGSCPGGAGCGCQVDNDCNGVMTCVGGVCTVP